MPENAGRCTNADSQGDDDVSAAIAAFPFLELTRLADSVEKNQKN
jgi:hypothetical protein